MIAITLHALGYAGSQASLPSVAQIMARSKRLYESCHTLQATLTMSGSLASKYTQVIEVKCEIGPGGIVKRGYWSGELDEPGRAVRKSLDFDDGVTKIIVFPFDRKFLRSSHVEQSVFTFLAGMVGDLDGGKANVSLVGTAQDPVYLITQALPKIAGTAELRISMLTGQFVEASTVGRINGKSIEMRYVMSHQIFDARIAPETFKWTPPKGFKEISDSD